jgi:hypothetical protein
MFLYMLLLLAIGIMSDIVASGLYDLLKEFFMGA